MGIPTTSLQPMSDKLASLGNYISLHTGAAGTTGANEATGGSYARVQSTPWTPDGSGNNTGPQVQINCAAGTYVEGGIFSTATGTTVSAPSSLAVTGSGTGGTFAAGTYFWVVTAINHAGETTVSNEVSATLSGSTSSAALTWTLPAGATGVKVYRGTTAGSENKLVATLGAVSSYTDTGTAGTTATRPSSNSTTTFIGSAAFSGGSVVVSGASASIKVNPTVSCPAP